MARSRLMRALQRLAREHAEASRGGVEPAKVREEWAAGSLERRRFLQGVGATGGAALISRSRTAEAAKPKPKIAIVGAGIAGLNAALTLKDAGFASTIYEFVRPHRRPHALGHDDMAEPPKKRVVRRIHQLGQRHDEELGEEV